MTAVTASNVLIKEKNEKNDVRLHVDVGALTLSGKTLHVFSPNGAETSTIVKQYSHGIHTSPKGGKVYIESKEIMTYNDSELSKFVGVCLQDKLSEIYNKCDCKKNIVGMEISLTHGVSVVRLPPQRSVIRRVDIISPVLEELRGRNSG